jgi:hypothetical protein
VCGWITEEVGAIALQLGQRGELAKLCGDRSGEHVVVQDSIQETVIVALSCSSSSSSSFVKKKKKNAAALQ